MTQQATQTLTRRADQRVQVVALTYGYNLRCGRVCDVQFVHTHHA